MGRARGHGQSAPVTVTNSGGTTLSKHSERGDGCLARPNNGRRVPLADRAVTAHAQARGKPGLNLQF